MTERFVVVVFDDSGYVAGVLGSWIRNTAVSVAADVERRYGVRTELHRVVPLRELSTMTG